MHVDALGIRDLQFLLVSVLMDGLRGKLWATASLYWGRVVSCSFERLAEGAQDMSIQKHWSRPDSDSVLCGHAGVARMHDHPRHGLL